MDSQRCLDVIFFAHQTSRVPIDSSISPFIFFLFCFVFIIITVSNYQQEGACH